MAAVASVAGGIGRLLMALHGGERRPAALAIDTALGAFLGLMVAGLALGIWPDLRGTGWQILTGFGLAGAAGAMGTRTLDMVTEAMRKRLL